MEGGATHGPISFLGADLGGPGPDHRPGPGWKVARPVVPNTGSEQHLTYPVPAASRAPKHLFHFIIRYEGEGIVDGNVADVLKAQLGKKEKEEKEGASVSSLPAQSALPSGVGDLLTGAGP